MATSRRRKPILPRSFREPSENAGKSGLFSSRSKEATGTQTGTEGAASSSARCARIQEQQKRRERDASRLRNWSRGEQSKEEGGRVSTQSEAPRIFFLPQIDARRATRDASSVRSAARLVLEARLADHRVGGMFVPNVVLHIELLFAKFAAVGALEARRFAAVVLVVSRDGALRGVALAAARTRVAGPRLPRAPARVGLLQPWQR